MREAVSLTGKRFLQTQTKKQYMRVLSFSLNSLQHNYTTQETLN